MSNFPHARRFKVAVDFCDTRIVWNAKHRQLTLMQFGKHYERFTYKNGEIYHQFGSTPQAMLEAEPYQPTKLMAYNSNRIIAEAFLGVKMANFGRIDHVPQAINLHYEEDYMHLHADDGTHHVYMWTANGLHCGSGATEDEANADLDDKVEAAYKMNSALSRMLSVLSPTVRYVIYKQFGA